MPKFNNQGRNLPQITSMIVLLIIVVLKQVAEEENPEQIKGKQEEIIKKPREEELRVLENKIEIKENLEFNNIIIFIKIY